MSIRIIGNNNLLTKIATYSDFDSLISFKLSKRKIGRKLDVEKNDNMNKIILFHYMSSFRNEEDEDDFDIKIGDIMYRSNDEVIKYNWEKKIKMLKEHKELMKSLLELKVNDVLDFIFKYHIYLPNLRKNNVHLEFSESSIVMLKYYDYIKLQTIQQCYYDKYITMEYMNDSTGAKNIIPLREKQYYEKELLNVNESFNEIKGNERYKRILIEQIMEYNYKIIKNEFKEMNKEQLKEINPIFFFIWAITVYFKFYLNNVNVSILRFKGEKREKYLNEFIKQHNQAMNVILFIDNTFNNVNIIVNAWYKFLNLENLEKKEKYFSLFDLLLKMYKDKIYDKIIEEVLEQFKEYIKENQNKEEEVKMIIEDDDDLNSTNDSSFSQEESECKKEEDDPIKKMIEQIGNIVLEMEMNPQNANGINHSGVKLGKVYEEYEKKLEDIMKENLNNLKEEEALKTFEKMKTLLETDKNPRSLISDNYKIINRTKKKLTKPLVEFFTEYTKSRFNIANKNYSYNTQNENFDDFSEESEREILNNINNDINNIKKELIEKEMESSGLPKKEIEIMVNNYVDKNGDDMITLYKEMILFHFREKQFHRENDQKIQKMLKGTKTDSCIFD